MDPNLYQKICSIANKYQHTFEDCDIVDLKDLSITKEGDFLSILPDVATPDRELSSQESSSSSVLSNPNTVQATKRLEPALFRLGETIASWEKRKQKQLYNQKEHANKINHKSNLIYQPDLMNAAPIDSPKYERSSSHPFCIESPHSQTLSSRERVLDWLKHQEIFR